MTTSNTATGIKWVVIGMIALFLMILYFQKCGKGRGVSVVTKTDTVYNDTGRIISRVDTHYIPKPYRVWKTDTLETFFPVPYDSANCAELAAAYNSRIEYVDTVYNGPAGKVTVTDTITGNMIVGRGVTAAIEKQIITKTVTITGTLPRRITGYYGLTAGGNKGNIFTTGGVTFGIMDRKGVYYGISGNLLLNSKPFYGAQVMFPIHLKK
jgi:hypothetical protein